MRTMLVVADEPSIRSWLTARFQREGWTVSSVARGGDAAAAAGQAPSAVTLIDLSPMADITPAKVCAAFRRHPELDSTILVVLTRVAFRLDAMSALRAGADLCIPKPFSSSCLQPEKTNLVRPATHTLLAIFAG